MDEGSGALRQQKKCNGKQAELGDVPAPLHKVFVKQDLNPLVEVPIKFLPLRNVTRSTN